MYYDAVVPVLRSRVTPKENFTVKRHRTDFTVIIAANVRKEVRRNYKSDPHERAAAIDDRQSLEAPGRSVVEEDGVRDRGRKCGLTRKTTGFCDALPCRLSIYITFLAERVPSI